MATTVRLDTLDDERLDVYARLTEHQLRNRLDPARAVLIAESRLVVSVALSAGVEPLSFLLDEQHLMTCSDLLALAGPEVPAFVLPEGEMSRLTGYKVTRGFLCAMRRPRPRSVSEVLKGARHVAVLEGLVDATNVGAIFRSAAALGADAVLLSPTCADALSRRTVRVSMGTVFQVPWARASREEWPTTSLGTLREAGFECLAMALEPGAVPIDDLSLVGGGRRALLFGCEGYGLTREALAACDRAVVIPMTNGVDSLNVAASSAVAFWQLFR